jgi:hypothetical protein
LERIGMIETPMCSMARWCGCPRLTQAYFGAYADFPVVRDWLDRLPNLYLVGRNGMHRYNNQDHSMLTAKCAVDAILSGSTDKQPIWDINVDDEYHEDSGAQA